MAPVPDLSMGNIAGPSFPPPDTRNASASGSSDLSPSPAVPLPQDQPSIPGKISLDTARPRGDSSASTTSFRSVKRKPLPATASALATRLSSGQHGHRLTFSISTTVSPPFTRSFADDSPIIYENPLTPFEGPHIEAPSPVDHREEERYFSSSGETLALTSYPSDSTVETKATPPKHRELVLPPDRSVATALDILSPSTVRQHELNHRDSELSVASKSTGNWYDDNSFMVPPQSATMSIFSSTGGKMAKPRANLSLNPISRTNSSESEQTLKPIQRSPSASKLGSFFGWGGGNISPASSTTTFPEDKPYSPIQSPPTPQSSLPNASTSSRKAPAGIDIPKANKLNDGYFGDAYLRQPPTAGSTEQVDEMEDELKSITAELATSIRREMELEDLVERLQFEAANPAANKRTSDYFSDSGTSSVKYGGEKDAQTEEMDKLARKHERETAVVKLELTDKLQEERSRRKVVEERLRNLEEKASHVDLASMNSLDTSSRLKDLENTCENLRRRLTEETQVKENFEDLLSALKGELQNSHNERDNLRDEIVPQLRARVEGLEAQAAEHEKLTYEYTKMQQEMQALRNENTTLIKAQKSELSEKRMSRFNTIAEDTPPLTPQSPKGLSRSNTVTVGERASRGMRSSSLSRSTSVKAGTGESRDVLVERVKDIEAQRDALHRALKSLLERQEHQNRANDRRIKQLEMERDRAKTTSPRRSGYNKEVATLREEINILRQRADDAIEQKWQCEKGLSGLKMDLDRAEQEISSLRGMLAETKPAVATRGPRSNSVTSESLEQSYIGLQQAYQASLERVKALENNPEDKETQAALSELENSLKNALIERDAALSEADALRATSVSFHNSEKTHMQSETQLASELRESARRVEELAGHVRQQLASNATLRQRLAETIDRGEKEQKSNAARIVSLQGKLKTLEDELVGAQQTTEERVAAHEEEIKTLKSAHSLQLTRVKSDLKSPRLFAPKSPLSPMFASGKSPRLSRTTSGFALSVSEDSKTEFLKQRVEELEKALEDADKEMEEVVGRMNAAQIEVMELWNEREEAVRVTRKLEREIEEEKKRGFETRFRTLQS